MGKHFEIMNVIVAIKFVSQTTLLLQKHWELSSIKFHIYPGTLQLNILHP